MPLGLSPEGTNKRMGGQPPLRPIPRNHTKSPIGAAGGPKVNPPISFSGVVNDAIARIPDATKFATPLPTPMRPRGLGMGPCLEEEPLDGRVAERMAEDIA